MFELAAEPNSAMPIFRSCNEEIEVIEPGGQNYLVGDKIIKVE